MVRAYDLQVSVKRRVEWSACFGANEDMGSRCQMMARRGSFIDR